jgi:hypothetical protein
MVGSSRVTKAERGLGVNFGAAPMPKMIVAAPSRVEATAEGVSMEPGIIVRLAVGTEAEERREESFWGVRTRARQGWPARRA